MTAEDESMVILTGAAGDHADANITSTEAEGDLTITENPDAGLYEAVLDGVTVAGVVYSRVGRHVTLLATSVFPQFRGKGIAARLLAGVLDRLRAEGDTITVSCPFATAFMKSHPEYAGLLPPGAADRPARARH